MFERLAPQYRQRRAVTVLHASDSREREKREAETHLATLRERINDLQIDTLEGDPRERVVELARELPAELVVTGKRGRNPLSDLSLGSTAEAACQRAPCAVLLVPSSPN